MAFTRSSVSTPVSGKGRENRLTELSAEKCINFFAVLRQEEQRTKKAYLGTAGRSLFCTIAGSNPCRGGIASKDGTEGYVVVGTTLYELSTSGTATSRGTISGSSRCQLVVGDDQVFIGDTGSTNAYVFVPSTNTLTHITDPDFLGCVTATYQDTYLIYNPNNSSGRFYLSDSGDFTSYSSLQFATIESYANQLIGLVSTLENLWLFGEEMGEIWYNSGANVPFDRRTNIVPGLLAPQSLAEHSGTIAWVSRSENEKVSVYAVTPDQPFSPKKIASPDIVYRLGQIANSTLKTSIGFFRCEDDSRFYHILVPGTCHLVYDFTTDEWHELQESDASAHTANCCFMLDGKIIVGSSADGKFYEMSLNYLDDNGTAVSRTLISPTLYYDNRWARCLRFQVDVAAGVGTVSITAPVLAFSYSKNSGHTYSTAKNLNLGASAEYTTRAFDTRLGGAKVWNFKLVGSQAVRYLINSFGAEMSVGGF